MAALVFLDDAAIHDMLNAADGPVGWVIDELAVKATETAKLKAPIQKPENWSWGFPSTSYEPRSVGYLKSRIHEHFPGYNGAGQLYGGVNAPMGPTMYLQYKGGRHGHARLNKFLTEALDELEL